MRILNNDELSLRNQPILLEQHELVLQAFDDWAASIGLGIIEDDIHVNGFVVFFFGAVEDHEDFAFPAGRNWARIVFGRRTIAGGVVMALVPNTWNT
jgi:hypothetical protein